MKNLKIEKVPAMVVFNTHYAGKTIVTMHWNLNECNFAIPTMCATLKNHEWTCYIFNLENDIDETQTKTTREIFEIAKKYGFI